MWKVRVWACKSKNIDNYWGRKFELRICILDSLKNNLGKVSISLNTHSQWGIETRSDFMMLILCKPFTTSLINAFRFFYSVRFPSLGYYKERLVVQEEWWVEEIVDLDNVFLYLGNARVVLYYTLLKLVVIIQVKFWVLYII